MRYLQDAEVRVVAADDLNTDGKAFGREAAGHGRGRIARCRDIPARLHPVDIIFELHTSDFGWVWSVDIERRHLGGGQNEVLVRFEKRLKAAPDLRLRGLRACDVRAGEA